MGKAGTVQEAAARLRERLVATVSHGPETAALLDALVAAVEAERAQIRDEERALGDFIARGHGAAEYERGIAAERASCLPGLRKEARQCRGFATRTGDDFASALTTAADVIERRPYVL